MKGTRRVAVCIAAFNGALFLWLVLRPASAAHIKTVDDVAQFLGPLLIVPLCFAGLVGGRRTRHSPVRHSGTWAAPLLGLGVLGFALGQMIWTIYEQVLHEQTPFPSWADAGFLSAYPFLLIGILVLPAGRMALVSRSRTLLDGLMIMVAAIAFSWYFVLGPTMETGGESTFAKIVGTAYPASDLVLIASVLLLAARARASSLQPIARLLGLGLSVIIVTDSLFDYETLHGTYDTGRLFDVGWPLGYMLVGLAAFMLHAVSRTEQAERRDVGPGTDHGRLRPRWHLLIPYAPVPAVVALVIGVMRTRADAQLDNGVFLGAAVLIGLVFIRQILTLMENAQLSERLQALATRDLLTNLPNHRALIGALDQELDRARRYERPCSIILLDLDHFKAINDGLGHAGGDAALQELSSVVRCSLRSIDILGRWGGEEFVVILPETECEGAVSTAERIRSAVASHPFAVGGGIHVTCSLGVASYPEDATERDTLLESADRAMYGAKRLGRNQVRTTGDPGIEAVMSEVESPDGRENTALLGTVEALAALVDARDAYTGEHAHHVSGLTRRLAVALGLDASTAHWVGLAARLHDIGKVGVPDAVLRKPAPLDEEEWALIRKHPAIGADIVSRVPGLRVLVPAIRHHHERWDGTGYPDRLAGPGIPLAARILGVADAYDAMLRDRPYRRSLSPGEALAEVRRCSGTQFDPQIVSALERAIAPEADLDRRVAG